jgi:transcription initiation factor TFIIIB Brf1 subunit/transcription initiation factor TFIIB
MSHIKNCEHISQVIDEHEGSIICTDCGLVINQYFINDHMIDDNPLENNSCQEFLERMNITMPLDNEIKKTACLDTIASDLYRNINKTSSISLKEILSVTGANEKKLIKKNRGHTTILNKDILLEKYCAQLNIGFKNYTVIKETLNKVKLTGHSPLTIIASSIYAFSKKNNLKISMKKVATTTGISCISIQRFLKHHQNELSYGC